MRAAFPIAILALLTFCLPAAAQVKLSGTFVARNACPATQAINGGSNRGNVRLEAGEGYKLLGGNKSPPTHFLIEVPGAAPEQRWVDISCGSIDGVAVAPATPDAAPADTPPAKVERPKQGRPQYILAISWQPAFCETRPSKTECRSMADGRFDTSNFTLHGLWPQPRSNQYCGVSNAQVATDEAGDWFDLPKVILSSAVRAELDEVMPGAASGLDRHQWTKHGVCYGTNAQTYFEHSLALMRQINASPVRELFEANIGKRLSSGAIVAAFDKAFGRGAGSRIRLNCANDDGRRLLGEITIAVGGEISANASFADLLAAAPSTSDLGCPGGLVDPVGLQ